MYKGKAGFYGAEGGGRERINPKLLFESIINVLKPENGSGFKEAKIINLEEANERWNSILLGQSDIKDKWKKRREWWTLEEISSMEEIKKERARVEDRYGEIQRTREKLKA